MRSVCAALFVYKYKYFFLFPFAFAFVLLCGWQKSAWTKVGAVCLLSVVALGAVSIVFLWISVGVCVCIWACPCALVCLIAKCLHSHVSCCTDAVTCGYSSMKIVVITVLLLWHPLLLLSQVFYSSRPIWSAITSVFPFQFPCFYFPPPYSLVVCVYAFLRDI